MSNRGKLTHFPKWAVLFFCMCAQIAMTSQPRPPGQSGERAVGTFRLKNGHMVEIILEEVKMEHDYLAPRGKSYKEVWLVLHGVIVSPSGRKPVWRVNYIEYFRDTQFTKPKYVPRDFHVAERDEDHIGVAFVIPPNIVASYQIDLRKHFKDPSEPPRVPAGQQWDFHYVSPEFYCTSIWRHQLPLSIELQKVLGSQEAGQLLKQHSARIIEFSWDKKADTWVIRLEIGPYQIEFTSGKGSQEVGDLSRIPWRFSRLIRKNTM